MNKKSVLLLILIVIFASDWLVTQQRFKNNNRRALTYIYTSTCGRYLRPMITNRTTNRIVGLYTNSLMSKIHIPSFVKKHAIDMNEYEHLDIKYYRSFNHFFTRKLKLGARSIDEAQDSIVSPADGQLHIIEQITPETTFLVKNIPFNLEQFLDDKTLADYFMGGTMIIIYLAPWNYHRFHFPIDCKPGAPKQIRGKYNSVNAIVYDSGIQPLLENERRVSILQTETDIVAMIAVGALFVGQITHTYESNKNYKKGDEAGFFSFGGSTIVLLFKKEFSSLDATLIDMQKNGKQIDIKMGQSIGKKIMPCYIS